jgi:PAS domain S-box-containing protein
MAHVTIPDELKTREELLEEVCALRRRLDVLEPALDLDVPARRQTEALLSAQNRVLEQISTDASLTDVLEVLTRVIEEEAPGMLCSVLLLDEASRTLHHGAAPSLPAEYCRAVDGVVIGPRVGSCGTAAYLGQPVIVEDIATDPLWAEVRDLALPHGLRACWSMPIRSPAGQVLGTFAMYYRRPRRPDAHDWRLIEVSSRLAALAIERKRAEAALQESEGRFRQMAASIREAFWMADAGLTQTLYISPAYEEIWGRSCQSLYDEPRSFYDSVHPDDQAAVYASLQRLHEGCIEQEFRILRPDGSVRWLWGRGFPIHNDRGELSRIVGIAQDVTERRQAAEALRESESWFQAFMDHSPAVAWLKDEELRYVYVNRTWEQCFQRRLADARGKTDLDGRPPHVGEELRQHDRAVLQADRVLEFEETVPDGDGRLRHWQVFKFPFRDAPGRRYVGGMAVDVTQRKEAEAKQSAYAERLEVLSRRVLDAQEAERRHLAAELHDEIGQLLTGINLNLQALKRAGGPTPPWLTESLAAVARAIQQTRDLSLDLRPSVLDDFGLEEALRWYTGRLAQRTGTAIELTMDLADGRLPPHLETACFRIVQEALTNVARHAEARRVQIDVKKEGSEVYLTIHDDGVGFHPEGLREKAARGEGVGLVGMQDRVRLVGGQMAVASKPGEGTTLRVHIPVAVAAAVEPNGKALSS